MKKTVNELKSDLSSMGQSAYLPRTKPDLVGCLIIEHARQQPDITIVPNHYYPTTKERESGILDYGLVSNLPLKYQEKVCLHFSHCLKLGKHLNDLKWYTDHMSRRQPPADPRASIRKCLYHALIWDTDIAYMTAFYTGFNDSVDINANDSWTWQGDDKGRLMDILIDMVLVHWQEKVQAHQAEMIRYNNPKWGFGNPFPEIADKIKDMISKKREKLEKQRELRSIMMKTFLYGCVTQESGAPLLPLIGARYAYGPVRKQIAQYVGAVDA